MRYCFYVFPEERIDPDADTGNTSTLEEEETVTYLLAYFAVD